MEHTLSHLRRMVHRRLYAVTMAVAVAACEAPSDPEARGPMVPSRPPENQILVTVGNRYNIEPPGGGNPRNAYVTVPNTETISNVATAEIDPPYVVVECRNPGDAWVKVHTENGYWRIYSLTCVDRIAGSVNAMVGEAIVFPVPGGFPQYVYVTAPWTEDVPEWAAAFATLFGVEAQCYAAGSAWIKVHTGNGFWKIYSLTCKPFLLEAQYTGTVDKTVSIMVSGGTPTGLYVTVPNRRDLSSRVEAHIESASLSASSYTAGEGVSVKATCKEEGSAWVRVRMGDEDENLYVFTCKGHDQGGGS